MKHHIRTGDYLVISSFECTCIFRVILQWPPGLYLSMSLSWALMLIYISGCWTHTWEWNPVLQRVFVKGAEGPHPWLQWALYSEAWGSGGGERRKWREELVELGAGKGEGAWERKGVVCQEGLPGVWGWFAGVPGSVLWIVGWLPQISWDLKGASSEHMNIALSVLFISSWD